MEQSILQIGADLAGGLVTSVDLVNQYIDRIGRYDSGRLNSIIELNPDALFIAENCDKLRREGAHCGPLFGVPILIKDNIDTGDKMRTTAGSQALWDNIAGVDSGVAKKLRQAGAIILGKTNMTEFANFMTAGMPGGYSSRGGQTVSPYHPDLTPSGSSAGSGVAAACNFAAGCIGTETNGSILSPSKNNCIVGIKPTVGLVSRSGVIPISHTQDTPGPMARTVTDAALMLNAISGSDAGDMATFSIPNEYIGIDYTERIGKSLKNMRIGYCTLAEVALNSAEKASLDLAKQVLAEAGATLVPVVLDYVHRGEKAKAVMLHQFKAGINAYLAKANCQNNSLEKVIAYNVAHPQTCLKYGQSILTESQGLSGRLIERTYLVALQEGTKNAGGAIDRVIEDNQLDLFIQSNYNSIHAISGYPAITVPTALPDRKSGKSIFFIGKKWQEQVLIQAAYAFEQGSLCRKAPTLYSVELGQVSDIDRVYAVYQNVASQDNCDWGQEYPGRDHVAADIANQSLYMAEDESGRIIGAISIDFNKDLEDCGLNWTKSPNNCTLSRLCVASDMQGHGLGKRLLLDGLCQAKDRGYAYVRILASRDNPTVIQMYESLGYRPTGDMRMYETNFRGYEVVL